MEYGKFFNSQVRKRYGYGIIFKSGVRDGVRNVGRKCTEFSNIIFQPCYTSVFFAWPEALPFLRNVACMLFCEWFFRYLLLNFLDELLYFTTVLNPDILVRVRVRKYGYRKKFDGYGTGTGEF